MRVAVPVIYEPGNGRRRRVSGLKYELGEISSSEAHVAIELKAGEHSGLRLDVGRMIKYLSYGGHLWQPRGLMGHDIYRFDPDRSVADQYRAARYEFNNAKRGIHPTDAHSRVQLYSDAYDLEADGSPEASSSPMAAAYEETFASHLLIDGELYVRSRGPLLTLSSEKDGAVAMHTDGRANYTIHGRIREFRADMHEEACEIAGRMFGRVRVIGEPPIIHDHSSLPDDSRAGAVEDLAWRILAETRVDYLGSLPREFVAANLALREALVARWPGRILNFNYTTWAARPYSEWETTFLPDANLVPLIEDLRGSYQFQRSLRDDMDIARARANLSQPELSPDDADALGI